MFLGSEDRAWPGLWDHWRTGYGHHNSSWGYDSRSSFGWVADHSSQDSVDHDRWGWSEPRKQVMRLEFEYHRLRMPHLNEHEGRELRGSQDRRSPDLGAHSALGHRHYDDQRSFGSVDRSSRLDSGLRRWDSGARRSSGCEGRRRFGARGERIYRQTRRSWSWGIRRGPLSGERHSSSGRSVGHWDRRQADPGDHKPLGSGRLVGRKL